MALHDNPTVTVRVEYHAFAPEDDSLQIAFLTVPETMVAGMKLEEIAEAVFVATNSPYELTSGSLEALFRQRYESLAQSGAYFPSLSVGDIVAVLGRPGFAQVERSGFEVVLP